jgi:hypothetical protein
MGGGGGGVVVFNSAFRMETEKTDNVLLIEEFEGMVYGSVILLPRPLPRG